MNAILSFEVQRSIKHWLTYLIAFILIGIGAFCGNKFNLTVGEGIYLNSPYTIGFMTGMLSLAVIFFATILASQQLFKDHDSKFDGILFSLPFSKWDYVSGRFSSFFLLTFLSFTFLMIGFMAGQNMRTGSEIRPYFNLWYYLFPFLIFGWINCLLVCSFLFFIALTTKKKLLVVIGGLLLYVLYMIILLFSNSPFMAGSIPQSLEAQQLSALIDPFGLSAYFFEGRNLSVLEKNESTIPFSWFLLINRAVFLAISVLFLILSYRFFSFSGLPGKKLKKVETTPPLSETSLKTYIVTLPDFGIYSTWRSVFSFAKIDLIYLFKGIIMVAVSILLLFFVGMEMYAEIEKGIRLPQKYASSGLMANTISENFHLFGLLITVYFINDLYWSSHSSGFSLIEKSTYFHKNKLAGHFLSITVLIFFFNGLLILEGLIFQWGYHYFHTDWNAYLGTILFNTFPLILFSGFVLLINDNIRNRFVALGISVLFLIMMATPITKKIISYPLLRMFSDFKGTYSDFNGYGIYSSAFAERLLFGSGIILFLWISNEWFKTKKWNFKKVIFTAFVLITGCFAGNQFMKGYLPKNEEESVLKAVNYEKEYRQYENLPQPVITDVITQIDLYPSQRSYEISGKYTLINPTDKAIDKILINFHPDLQIQSAILQTSSETKKIDHTVTEIQLKKPLQPNETAHLNFKISYKWFAVNGHESFNAIVENGSFMRISRYYPTIGYQKDNEIEDQKQRNAFKLGKLQGLKKLEAPEVFRQDFITLNMMITTEKDQTAVGTGDLTDQFTRGERQFFHYQSKNIPFRFAVSSAKYKQKNISYKGITINVFYHEKHDENVDHLINNAKITLDYCIRNFGNYPFKTINFAEISSFTRGFAATAYPSAVFMPEDMIFHANIHADEEQDVINELAGHELSHLWWGNSQIDPDEREGSPMLTETLAMYTEMMLYKKMHGKNKMIERIKVHQQIYDNEKGLSQEQPVYKVTGNNTHISYSKGAIAMVKLSELLGEEKVNLALKRFLQNNRYPKKPTTLDLLREFYTMAPNEHVKKKIDMLFKTI
ncbi:M1 family aminopeptidase [Chryseobacterium daecheongense]|uniref:Aminopeptidase n=1 Tax=Chryseobacterium daecheongense TaxID=192389 RepID=A0A3N0VYR8_9FLAO|nr:M1 family aminopeptidase [Chryseobacterium daecheongense]ROH97944.1 aminopeptidase [Chryseobacterium daecheongense]TDX92876.1 peptidase M1-like protein [Chryseobacterium daecheongense]